MADLSFPADFPPASEDDWRRLAEGVLKGASFDRKLVSRSADGLAIQPLYPKATGCVPVHGRAPGRPWAVLQRVDHPDAREANALALLDLENGATGLELVFSGAVGAHGFGLADGSRETLAAALHGVVLDAGIRLELDLSYACKDAPQALVQVAKDVGFNLSSIDIGLGFDPLGQIALLGGTPVPWDALAPIVADLAGQLRDSGIGGQVVAADGRIVHAAGGSEAQELAFALSAALAYWRAFEAGGIDPAEGRRWIGFRLAADADQFMTIAKFRALRLLWARIEEAAGLSALPIHLHAGTSWRMLTRDDPWTNLLRTTVAVFSAGLGGADSVSVVPFTAARGLPDAFARRLARNTQLILLEEANLARVADPAAGSGGLEALTDGLCHSAWAQLQDIERQGGLAAALAAGTIQDGVAKVRATRAHDIATRRQPLTGASDFPDLGQGEVPVLVPAPDTAPSPARVGWTPMVPHRLAEPWEALRSAAQAGGAPIVFLATLGPVSEFNARATFARNLFEAGGLKATASDGYAGPDGSTDLAALGDAFRSSGASIACLCGSDERYAAEARTAATVLRTAGARAVWLAGRPGDADAGLREAGVDGFVFAGCDAIEALREVQAALGLGGQE
jgi:methylmalonyl-CoA mutase